MSSLRAFTLFTIMATSPLAALAQTDEAPKAIDGVDQTQAIDVEGLYSKIRNGSPDVDRAAAMNAIKAGADGGDQRAAVIFARLSAEAGDAASAVKYFELASADISSPEDDLSPLREYSRWLQKDSGPLYNEEMSRKVDWRLAELGDGEAAVRLAQKLSMDSKTAAQSLTLLELPALAANPDVQFRKGLLLANGSAGRVDNEGALIALDAAAQANVPGAQLEYARLKLRLAQTDEERMQARELLVVASASTEPSDSERAARDLVIGDLKGSFGVASKTTDALDTAHDMIASGDLNVAVAVIERRPTKADKIENTLQTEALELLLGTLADQGSWTAKPLFDFLRWRARDDRAAENLLAQLVEQQSENIGEQRATIYSSEKTVAAALATNDFPAVSKALEGLDPATFTTFAFKLAASNVNAFVYVAQSKLTSGGYYDGKLNGLMTRSTILAINRLCDKEIGNGSCALGPLRSAVLKHLIPALSEL
jgi:TPR repeat protein